MSESIQPVGISRQKIPLLLKLKRLKNSGSVAFLNNFISGIKPPKKYSGIPKRILLFRNDRIGDAIVTLPVIRDIKTNYPDIIIDVIVSPLNRFVFEGFEYVDNLIELELTDYRGSKKKMPVAGGFFQFLKFLFFPFIFSPGFRKKLNNIRANNYDAAADLVGLKRNAIVAGRLSRFTVGPGKLAAFLFYDYYSSSNWVTSVESDFMTRKIEMTLRDALGLKLHKRDVSLPIIQIDPEDENRSEKEFDIMFHFGTSDLRKFSVEKESKLLGSFSDYNIIVTDSEATERFLKLREFFKSKENISFRTYPALKDMIRDCRQSGLLVTYDGGQSHFLAQYTRTLAIFGPGSVQLWKPYEFEDYHILETHPNGTKAIESAGKFRHIAIYKSMWCNPCFDIGCVERPCLNEISIEFVANIITKYCLNW